MTAEKGEIEMSNRVKFNMTLDVTGDQGSPRVLLMEAIEELITGQVISPRGSKCRIFADYMSAASVSLNVRINHHVTPEDKTPMINSVLTRPTEKDEQK